MNGVDNELGMRTTLAKQPDIKGQVSALELAIVHDHRHFCDFLPKYHCELNPIELVWARSKRYVRDRCIENYGAMLKSIPPSLSEENIPLHLIQQFFMRVRDFITVYREGGVGGESKDRREGGDASEALKMIMTLKKEMASHRTPPPSWAHPDKVKHRPWEVKKGLLGPGVKIAMPTGKRRSHEQGVYIIGSGGGGGEVSEEKEEEMMSVDNNVEIDDEDDVVDMTFEDIAQDLDDVLNRHFDGDLDVEDQGEEGDEGGDELERLMQEDDRQIENILKFDDIFGTNETDETTDKIDFDNVSVFDRDEDDEDDDSDDEEYEISADDNV